MSGVVNDIEALAEFRSHLMRFNHDLAENFSTIQGHWRELGEVWRDDMYRLFGEALDEVLPGITAYLAATEGHEAHLAALIERLEQIRLWQQRIDAGASEFRATSSRFTDLLENELPRMEEHLAAIIARLEAARRVQAAS